MKILISSLTYPLPNGVTVSINRTIDGFKKKGIKTLVISPDYNVGRVRKEHRIVPSSLIVKNAATLIGKEERTFGFGAYNKIEEIAQKFTPDIYWLHSTTFTPNAFERFIFKTEIPKVVSYHTLVEEYGKIYGGLIGVKMMKARSKAVCNGADFVITPTQVMKEKLISYGVTTPIEIIPTGISIPKNQLSKNQLCKKFNLNSQSKILLYVGRISIIEKNLEFLLKALKGVVRSGIDARLLLVGPGDIEELKELARELKISSKVIFTGGLPKEEAQRIYGGADLFVFSSQTETQGLVLGEAMAAKKLVLALKSPIQEEIYPEGTAIISSNLTEFTNNLIFHLNNPNQGDKIKEKAKEFVTNNFSEELMIKRQIELFQRLKK